jgi:hypothetical protein
MTQQPITYLLKHIHSTHDTQPVIHLLTHIHNTLFRPHQLVLETPPRRPQVHPLLCSLCEQRIPVHWNACSLYSSTGAPPTQQPQPAACAQEA